MKTIKNPLNYTSKVFGRLNVRKLNKKIVGSLVLLTFMQLSVFANTSITSFKVKRLGTARENTQHIILIPGLMSDGRVWTDLAKDLSVKSRVHLINLAGFGGTEKIKGQSLTKVKRELFDYLTQQGLHKPTIIGHSLGGFMAFWMATTHSELIGSIISIDGLPFIGPVFTRSNETTVDSLKPQADQIRHYYAQMTVEQLLAQTEFGIGRQVSNEKGKKNILDMAATSDPNTVGESIYALMSTDLRQSLAQIKNPTLLIGAAGGFSKEVEKLAAKKLYQQQLDKLKGAKLVMSNDSRHFIMYDQPDWLSEQIFKFLNLDKKLSENVSKKSGGNS